MSKAGPLQSLFSVFFYLLAGFSEMTNTDVEVITVDSLSRQAAESSQTVTD